MESSNHAQLRSNQRKIHDNAIDAALEFGRLYRQPTGRVIIHIGKKSVKHAKKYNVDIRKFENVAVIIDSMIDIVVTVYKCSKTKRLKWRSKKHIDFDDFFLHKIQNSYDKKADRKESARLRTRGATERVKFVEKITF